AVPELLDHSGLGGEIELREVPNAEPGMSPMEIWCNEAQERYVLAIAPGSLDEFAALCERERCLFAVIGKTTEEPRLLVHDRHFGNDPIDMPMQTLLGNPPRMHRDVSRQDAPADDFDGSVDVAEALYRLLRLPTVADKRFLVTIGDRSVGGLTARDQMVGPWQEALSDVAVTSSGYDGYTGEAMAMGERTPVAVLNAPASGRLAIGEALTNIAAADIDGLSDIRLSANWMAAAGHAGDDADLYATVRAVGEELCPALGIAIPVGKDSLSMRTSWQDGGRDKLVAAPVSLVISAFAPVGDVRRTLTPVLNTDDDTRLILIDLGKGANRLGGSSLAQVYAALGGATADVDDATRLRSFFDVIGRLRAQDQLLAYHDRSDGGLAVTLCEMAFAARCGLSIRLPSTARVAATLFSEELGAVIQVRADDEAEVLAQLLYAGLGDCSRVIGKPRQGERVTITVGDDTVIDESRIDLHKAWAETSYLVQSRRDNPRCATEEYERIDDSDDPGLSASLSFDPNDDICAPFVNLARPRIAILREQGVNGHNEMAAAFDRAGFEAIDVHMSEILSGITTLDDDFAGLAACGGFSYGDVLGAGEGWAKSILYHGRARDQFASFFADPSRFALGICNGCQMIAALHDIVPGAAHWPRFVRNESEQFEARLAMVRVEPSPSLFFAGMAGSVFPVVVSHGEGRVHYAQAPDERGVALRYVDNYGDVTTRFPANPNGSTGGITGLCNDDGRITIMMPHPERIFRSTQMSWHPPEWSEASPWLRLFRNARAWLA
ncbi:MAG: phosphoribosylformylglycinamidine synthase, partial [Gammaproteobacteria bacterium]|nr:phosphoribosylformylglycinamidine synthase [Gammaproteobacteria bacterium]